MAALLVTSPVAASAVDVTKDGDSSPSAALPLANKESSLATLPSIHLQPPVSSAGTVSPQLAPGTIALCNLGFGDTVIGTWTAKTLKINIDLKCGDSNSGYVHIRANHQSQWQSLIDWAGGGAVWDDLMAFSVGGSLTAPSSGYPKNMGSNKYCYTSRLYCRSQMVRRRLGIRPSSCPRTTSASLPHTRRLCRTARPFQGAGSSRRRAELH